MSIYRFMLPLFLLIGLIITRNIQDSQIDNAVFLLVLGFYIFHIVYKIMWVGKSLNRNDYVLGVPSLYGLFMVFLSFFGIPSIDSWIKWTIFAVISIISLGYLQIGQDDVSMNRNSR